MAIFLVALSTGGIMEQPELSYSNFQLIEAASAKKAKEIYNIKNNCSYFYGEPIAKVNDSEKVEPFLPQLGSNIRLLLDLSFAGILERAENEI